MFFIKILVTEATRKKRAMRKGKTTLNNLTKYYMSLTLYTRHSHSEDIKGTKIIIINTTFACDSNLCKSTCKKFLFYLFSRERKNVVDYNDRLEWILSDFYRKIFQSIFTCTLLYWLHVLYS